MYKKINKKNLRILLTGANGLVGKNLKKNLLKKNFKVFTPSKKDLNLLYYNKIDKFLKNNKINFIIHAASKVGGILDNSVYRIEYLTNNTLINNNIITCAYKNKIKYFLNIGSSCMYPFNISGYLDENMINDGKLEPTNEGHAFSKLYSSKLCTFITEDNKNFFYKTLIPCNLYGDNDNFNLESSHFIPAIIKKISLAKLQNKKEVIVWGDGKPRREIMHVQDLSDGIIFCIKKFEKIPNVLNIGPGSDLKIIDYYKIVSKILNHKTKFVFDLSKPNGMKRKVLNVKKINSLGWYNKISANKGLKITTLKYFNNIKNNL